MYDEDDDEDDDDGQPDTDRHSDDDVIVDACTSDADVRWVTPESERQWWRIVPVMTYLSEDAREWEQSRKEGTANCFALLSATQHLIQVTSIFTIVFRHLWFSINNKH